MNENMTPVTIGYWDMKGSAEYPRWVASYLGIPFIAKTHNQDWFEKGEKFLVGLDFPNLPYLIDGDYKMSESKAIAYYIAAKANNTEILGGDLFGQAKVRQIIDVACDINSAFQKDLWGPLKGDMVSDIKKAVTEGAIPEKNWATIKISWEEKSLCGSEANFGGPVCGALELGFFHYHSLFWK